MCVHFVYSKKRRSVLSEKRREEKENPQGFVSFKHTHTYTHKNSWHGISFSLFKIFSTVALSREEDLHIFFLVTVSPRITKADKIRLK